MNCWELNHSEGISMMQISPDGGFVRLEDHEKAVAALAAQVEALRVDAERLDWLEGKATLTDYDGGNEGRWSIQGIPAYSTWIRNRYDYKTFKGAIDAARAGKEG